jgi:hypothetical protein
VKDCEVGRIAFDEDNSDEHSGRGWGSLLARRFGDKLFFRNALGIREGLRDRLPDADSSGRVEADLSQNEARQAYHAI